MMNFKSLLFSVWMSLFFMVGTTTANTMEGVDCTFETIVERCGDVRMHSIDDTVYGYNPLREWKLNVIDKVAAYDEKLKSGVALEGHNNPDVAISYAFMHYVCFEPLIAPGEENKVYECMLEFCPRVRNIDAWCEGLNA